jgi:hypothetical protein
MSVLYLSVDEAPAPKLASSVDEFVTAATIKTGVGPSMCVSMLYKSRSPVQQLSRLLLQVLETSGTS